MTRSTDQSNRNLLFSYMQQIGTRLTTIQDQIEKFTAYTLEQFQEHAIEMEQLRSDVDQLQTRVQYLSERKPG